MANEAARAKAGATFLDVNCVGWPERIDADRLDLSCCVDCVLGQAFDNEYENVCLNLGLPTEQRMALGFTSGALLDHTHATYMALSREGRADVREQITAEYLALKAAWLHEIALRLNSPEAEEARIEAQPEDVGCVWGAL